MDLASSLSIEVFMRLEEVSQPAPPVREPRFIIVGDEELAEYHYQSRTSPANMDWKYACTPSVQRFYKDPIEKQGDFRVDISPLRSAIVALNGGNMQKVEYLFNPGTALYNNTGYPKQAYISMSGNELRGERVGEWFRFQTLRPTENVGHMTYQSHPWFVHRFDLVCWSARTHETYHKPVRWGWEILFYLVSNEGVGWVPWRYVKEV